MTPSEIIIKEAQSQGVDPETAVRQTSGAVKSGHAVLLQKNNSILLVVRLGDGRAALYLSTADSPITLRSSFSGFLKKLKASEVKKAYIDTKNPQIVRLMKKTGWDVEKSDMPKFTYMAKIK